MGKLYIIYDDQITHKNMENGNIYDHGCTLCKEIYICRNLKQWHFCDEGYHGIANNFVCSRCLTHGFQPS